jgi:hypothetical protein
LFRTIVLSRRVNRLLCDETWYAHGYTYFTWRTTDPTVTIATAAMAKAMAMVAAPLVDSKGTGCQGYLENKDSLVYTTSVAVIANIVGRAYLLKQSIHIPCSNADSSHIRMLLQ